MLGDSNVVAVVAVKDLATGNEFYGGTLGLRESDMDEPGGTLYSCGGGSLLLVYESSYAGPTRPLQPRGRLATLSRRSVS